jgi:hypothetical protein
MVTYLGFFFRSGPQLEPAGSHLPVRPVGGGETLTLPVTTYSLPRKISPDHYRPPSPPPCAAAAEETRSQNLTVVAAGRAPGGHNGLAGASREPADLPPLLVYPSGGTPNVSDLPAAAYQPSLIGGPLANSRPGGGSTLSSVPGSELPQHISFRHQQAQWRLLHFYKFPFLRYLKLLNIWFFFSADTFIWCFRFVLAVFWIRKIAKISALSCPFAS